MWLDDSAGGRHQTFPNTQAGSREKIAQELEGCVQERAQEFIQGILEEEVTEACWVVRSRSVGGLWTRLLAIGTDTASRGGWR